jgi:hypothetical protein
MVETRGVQIRVLTSHVGYKPELGKLGIVESPFEAGTRFRVQQIGLRRGTEPRRHQVALEGALAACDSDWGAAAVADFSEVREPGLYVVEIADHDCGSLPFIVGTDAYVRTMEMAFDFLHWTRCGTAVPGYHGICHLDDAVAGDGGEQLGLAGGWHDAGDVRKWMTSAMLAEYALLEVQGRLSPPWDRHGSPWGDVLNEFRWENAYVLNMQDPATGCVWFATAHAQDDQRWTDNVRDSGDERQVERTIRAGIQWEFIAVQARAAQAFALVDPIYASRCAEAAARCWHGWAERCSTGAPPAEGMQGDTSPGALDTTTLAWACLASLEVSRMGAWDGSGGQWRQFAQELMRRQCREYEHGQTQVRGYFYADAGHSRALKHHCTSGMPIIALARLLEAYPETQDARQWRDAISLYVEDYALPMTARTPFAIVPYGLYLHPPIGQGHAWPLGGRLSYRYFKWDEARSEEDASQRKETFEHGATSHLLSQGVALALADRVLDEPRARQLAYRQLEWVMGANPYAACLMTGGGLNSPCPYSRAVGSIVGGIMNGFIGGEADEPFLDMNAVSRWNTTEYWIPHNAHYLWALSVLEQGRGLTL